MTKIATDLKQSKKLAKILPIESTDMYWDYDTMQGFHRIELFEEGYPKCLDENDVPAWSLTALLNVLPSATLDSSDDHYYRFHCMEKYTEWYDNAIDACYELILKLNERKML